VFQHVHPYDIYIPDGTEKLIIGTLPPPRFSFGKLKKRDVNFCYGSCDGLLWPLLDKIFDLSLIYDNSKEAVDQRKEFLISQRIGICNIVASCRREKIESSDLGMKDITLRDIIVQLERHSSIHTLIFTGGNSKNGPEYLFRKQLRKYGLQLECVQDKIPRIHSVTWSNRRILTISLTSPSSAANRGIGSNQLYKERKLNDPSYTVFQFRLEQYRTVFCSPSNPNKSEF